MRQILRRMEMIHPMIDWRQDEHKTHKHAHSLWILWSVSHVRSKTMHSLSRHTSWLPYITLCYIDSRFFLPLEQSHTALLGCRLAASCLRKTAHWQLVICNKTKDYFSWEPEKINVKFRKNCENTGKILKKSCVRCHFLNSQHPKNWQPEMRCGISRQFLAHLLN